MNIPLLPAAWTTKYHGVEPSIDDDDAGVSMHNCLKSNGIELPDCESPQRQSPEPKVFNVWDASWWRFTHALGFCIGGILFTIGTLLYYPAISEARENHENSVVLLSVWTAWLYIVGSAGFLYVDVQEFFSFTDDLVLRINISCSMIGSTLYLVGSAGFLPSIYNMTPLVGILGFLLGSAFIGCSQAWKLVRILSSLSKANGEEISSTINAACVEGGAMIGGFCFLVGTGFFWKGPIEGDTDCLITCNNYELVLLLWSIGSFAFSFGGLSLAYRHAVLNIT